MIMRKSEDYAAGCLYFILSFALLLVQMDCLPLQTHEGKISLARKVRQTRSDLLRKSFDVSKLCPPGLTLTIGQKRLNLRKLIFSSADMLELGQSLYEQSVEERVDIWCKVAQLTKELASGIGRTVNSFDVTTLDLYQGDILLTKDTVDLAVAYGEKRRSLFSSDNDRSSLYHSRQKRKVISYDQFKWEDGIVPWRFDDNGAFDPTTRRNIRTAISTWEQRTCLRFPETQNPGNRPHVRFISDNGCYSFVGKSANGQPISLGPGCRVTGIVEHEIGHAIGMLHEQSRPDRNRYVDINVSNIKPGFECNFFSGSWNDFLTNKVPYDYASVMHYGSKDFGENPGIETVIPKDRTMRFGIGQRNGLSFWDARLANDLYCNDKCGGRSLAWNRCQHEGYRNPNNCNQCICPSGFAPPFCRQPERNPSACGVVSRFFATDAVDTFESPGYTDANGHPSNIECTYMFTAPSNKRLSMRFRGNFRLDSSNNQACRSYVEVRYQNMALEGPRYCGIGAPSDVFVSHGSTIIVRFFTRERRFTGFQLEYSAETCGGCSTDSANSEPACLRTNLFSCNARYDLGVRENRCFDVNDGNKRYCCRGYTRAGVNCNRNSVKTDPPPIVRPTTTTTPGPTPPTREWGPWTPWSRCSATCGLCGNQRRTRVCQTQGCVGPSSEQRICASRTCPTILRPRLCFTPTISICYDRVGEPCCGNSVSSGRQCRLLR